jgi:putative spermidine/putrescine transport system substrate-binding protein
MAPPSRFSRRQALQLVALGGAGGLVGCRGGGEAEGRLISVRGQMPPAWLKQLPAAWHSQPLESPDAVLAAREQERAPSSSARLLALGDGWAQRLAPADLQPFHAPALLQRLAPFAAAPSRLFAPAGAPALAFPWAFGCWLLLLRDRDDLLQRHAEGWQLLLDPSLRGRLVLPSSPRLVIELACRQLGIAATAAALNEPRLSGQLRRLLAQAVALDERDGANLLLAGDAEAAVLPSHQVIPLLLSDPRLSAVLPASGSPLWWQLLLHSAPATGHGAAQAPKPHLPLAWLEQGLALPLLDRLLAGGWVPPLQPAALAPALARWPQRLRPLLLPPAAVLARCNSLEAWSATEQQRWQQVWNSAQAPA